MLANEPKRHAAEFKTMKKQKPWFKYTEALKKGFDFCVFIYQGLKKNKENNKNGEDREPNLTLDVMKMSVAVIRGYRISGCFEAIPLT